MGGTAGVPGSARGSRAPHGNPRWSGWRLPPLHPLIPLMLIPVISAAAALSQSERWPLATSLPWGDLDTWNSATSDLQLLDLLHQTQPQLWGSPNSMGDEDVFEWGPTMTMSPPLSSSSSLVAAAEDAAVISEAAGILSLSLSAAPSAEVLTSSLPSSSSWTLLPSSSSSRHEGGATRVVTESQDLPSSSLVFSPPHHSSPPPEETTAGSAAYRDIAPSLTPLVAFTSSAFSSHPELPTSSSPRGSPSLALLVSDAHESESFAEETPSPRPTSSDLFPLAASEGGRALSGSSELHSSLVIAADLADPRRNSEPAVSSLVESSAALLGTDLAEGVAPGHGPILASSYAAPARPPPASTVGRTPREGIPASSWPSPSLPSPPSSLASLPHPSRDILPATADIPTSQGPLRSSRPPLLSSMPGDSELFSSTASSSSSSPSSPPQPSPSVETAAQDSGTPLSVTWTPALPASAGAAVSGSVGSDADLLASRRPPSLTTGMEATAFVSSSAPSMSFASAVGSSGRGPRGTVTTQPMSSAARIEALPLSSQAPAPVAEESAALSPVPKSTRVTTTSPMVMMTTTTMMMMLTGAASLSIGATPSPVLSEPSESSQLPDIFGKIDGSGLTSSLTSSFFSPAFFFSSSLPSPSSLSPLPSSSVLLQQDLPFASPLPLTSPVASTSIIVNREPPLSSISTSFSTSSFFSSSSSTSSSLLTSSGLVASSSSVPFPTPRASVVTTALPATEASSLPARGTVTSATIGPTASSPPPPLPPTMTLTLTFAPAMTTAEFVTSGPLGPTVPTTTQIPTPTLMMSTVPTTTQVPTPTSMMATVPTTTKISTPTSMMSTVPTTTQVPTPTSMMSTVPTTTQVPTPTSMMSPVPTTTVPTTTQIPTPTSMMSMVPATTQIPTPTSMMSMVPATTQIPTPTPMMSPVPTTTQIPTPTPMMSPVPATTQIPTPTPMMSTVPATTQIPTPTPMMSSVPATTQIPTPTPMMSSVPATTQIPTPTPMMSSVPATTLIPTPTPTTPAVPATTLTPTVPTDPPGTLNCNVTEALWVTTGVTVSAGTDPLSRGFREGVADGLARAVRGALGEGDAVVQVEAILKASSRGADVWDVSYVTVVGSQALTAWAVSGSLARYGSMRVAWELKSHGVTGVTDPPGYPHLSYPTLFQVTTALALVKDDIRFCGFVQALEARLARAFAAAWALRDPAPSPSTPTPTLAPGIVTAQVLSAERVPPLSLDVTLTYVVAVAGREGAPLNGSEAAEVIRLLPAALLGFYLGYPPTTLAEPVEYPILDTSARTRQLWVLTVLLDVTDATLRDVRGFAADMERRLASLYARAERDAAPSSRRTRRAATNGRFTVQVVNASRGVGGGDRADVVHYARLDGRDLPALDAVALLASVSQQTAALALGRRVLSLAAPVMQLMSPSQAPVGGAGSLWIIAAVVVPAALALALSSVLYWKLCRSNRMDFKADTMSRIHRAKSVQGFDYAKKTIGSDLRIDQEVATPVKVMAGVSRSPSVAKETPSSRSHTPQRNKLRGKNGRVEPSDTESELSAGRGDTGVSPGSHETPLRNGRLGSEWSVRSSSLLDDSGRAGGGVTWPARGGSRDTSRSRSRSRSHSRARTHAQRQPPIQLISLRPLPDTREPARPPLSPRSPPPLSPRSPPPRSPRSPPSRSPRSPQQTPPITPAARDAQKMELATRAPDSTLEQQQQQKRKKRRREKAQGQASAGDGSARRRSARDDSARRAQREIDRVLDPASLLPDVFVEPRGTRARGSRRRRRAGAERSDTDQEQLLPSDNDGSSRPLTNAAYASEADTASSENAVTAPATAGSPSDPASSEATPPPASPRGGHFDHQQQQHQQHQHNQSHHGQHPADNYQQHHRHGAGMALPAFAAQDGGPGALWVVQDGAALPASNGGSGSALWASHPKPSGRTHQDYSLHDLQQHYRHPHQHQHHQHQQQQHQQQHILPGLQASLPAYSSQPPLLAAQAGPHHQAGAVGYLQASAYPREFTRSARGVMALDPGLAATTTRHHTSHGALEVKELPGTYPSPSPGVGRRGDVTWLPYHQDGATALYPAHPHQPGFPDGGYHRPPPPPPTSQSAEALLRAGPGPPSLLASRAMEGRRVGHAGHPPGPPPPPPSQPTASLIRSIREELARLSGRHTDVREFRASS
ncbi:uncharacterized protein LOC116940080 isoform X2 [Petromyzon marinus]|uniref:uncharacterized protein LOC116940080 isoform X2 n=1 Tax=Petromyzon marinus TaxID=7757 RepID=UPI003F6F8DCF